MPLTTQALSIAGLALRLMELTLAQTAPVTTLPLPGDDRKLRVSFYDGTGWKQIKPDNVIRSVPYAGYALSAQMLGTNIASDFLLKAGLPTCSSGTFLTWSGTVTALTSPNSYLSVATGTSTPVLTLNVGTAAGSVAADTSWAANPGSEWITSRSNIYYNSGNVGIGTSACKFA